MAGVLRKLGDMPRGAWRFALALLIVAGVAGWQLADRLLSLDWQTTVGEVTQAEIRQFQSGDDLLHYFSLRYRYKAAGEEHVGRRVTVSGFMDATRLEQRLDDGNGFTRRFPLPRVEYPLDLAPYSDPYPAGQPVTVHYDPDDPTRSALTLESDWRWLGFFAAVLMFALVAGVVSWLFARMRRSAAPTRGDASEPSAPTPRKRRWGLIVVGTFGLVIASCSYYQERQAAAALPTTATPAELCQQPEERDSGWLRVTLTVPPTPRWRRTELVEPAWAQCPDDRPVPLEPPFQFQRMMDLLGCAVAIEGTGVRATSLVSGLDRLQEAHLFTSPETGAWALGVATDGPVDGQRQRWVGRLTLVRDLPSNRPELAGSASSLSSELAGAPFVILSDRPIETLNLEPALHEATDCAWITIPPRLAGNLGQPHEWWVRPLPNSRRWPNSFTPPRPLLLRAASREAYEADRTFWWRGIRWLGEALAIFGLVPVLIAGVDWLRRGRHRP